MSSTHFRLVLVASMILGLIGGFFDLMFPSAVPEALSQAQAAYDAELSTPALIVAVLVGLITLVGGIAAFVGLFIFRPWAPRLAVVTTALALFVWPALGANVSSGWSVALADLSSTLWGVVLAVVYFSPLKERFIATR